MSEYLESTDVFTKVSKYTLIRKGRMLHLDVHERIAGSLAAAFIAVPNLITIIAPPELQGTGDTADAAIEDCLRKLQGRDLEEIFPGGTQDKSPQD